MTTSDRQTPPTPPGLEWLISRFVEDVPGVSDALLLATDGLAVNASAGLDGATADRLAATASGLLSIASAMAREHNGGEVEILTFRTPAMHFLFKRVAERAGLAVLADRTANLNIVGHEMHRLVTAVGEKLEPDLRPPLNPGAITSITTDRP